MRRHITIVAIGARGDVQPLIALGAGLVAAGYVVRVATHTIFEALVLERGLGFAPLEGDPVAEFRRALQHEPGPVGQMRSLVRVAARLQRRWMAESWAASRDADAIVVSLFGGLPGAHVAERLGLPLIRAYSNPVTPTRSVSQNPGASFRSALSFALVRIMTQAAWGLFRPPVNAARRDVLGLPAVPFGEPFGGLDRRRCPLLYGYSPSIFPRPPDWGAWIEVTGYWFLERSPDWRPPHQLVDFIGAGPPPVFVGFGSNAMDRASARRTQTVITALRRAEQRAVLVRGSGALDRVDLPPDMLMIDNVPYDWLFPRMATLIHHGGAGTTAWGLRAGIPAIIVPSIADQPFWAERVYRAGGGPRPIPPRALTVDRLTETIQATVRDSSMGDRTRRLADAIRAEKGVERAVVLVERHLRAA